MGAERGKNGSVHRDPSQRRGGSTVKATNVVVLRSSNGEAREGMQWTGRAGKAPVANGVMAPLKLSAPRPLENLRELGVPEPIGPKAGGNRPRGRKH